MPIEKYDRHFGGKPGSAARAKRSMERQYGKEKGTQVFYATVNQRANKRLSDGTRVNVHFKPKGRRRGKAK